MIDKTESCALCGVEVCFAHGIAGCDKSFCSDECAEAYASTKIPSPCPFCGVQVSPHYYDGHGWSIECRNDTCPIMPETRGFYPLKWTAVSVWNKRYDVLAMDGIEEIAILHRIVRRLERFSQLPELP